MLTEWGEPHGAHVEQSFFMKYMWSTDHKVIAFQYMFTGMAMGLIGVFMAYVFRMQIAFPGHSVPGYGLVTPNQYNALVTNHGSIMIFWVAMPVLIAAFGNYLIPLMIGCDDMAFPRINRLSYHLFLLSAGAGRQAARCHGRHRPPAWHQAVRGRGAGRQRGDAVGVPAQQPADDSQARRGRRDPRRTGTLAAPRLTTRSEP